MDLFEHAQDRREDVAAQKIQAIQRGRQDRERLQAQNASAAKIQSIQRGRQTRKQAQLERRKRQEREAAAEKIQAIQRGRQARKKPLRSQYDWVGGAKGQSFYGGVDLNNAPVATLAAESQPYPMHVVHQQHTTHYLTYPGPGGQMPPPIFNPPQPGMTPYAYNAPPQQQLQQQPPQRQQPPFYGAVQGQMPPPQQQMIAPLQNSPQIVHSSTMLPPPSSGFNPGMVPPLPMSFNAPAMMDSPSQFGPPQSSQIYSQALYPQQMQSPPQQAYVVQPATGTDSLNSSRKAGFKTGFKVVEPTSYAKEFQKPKRKKRKDADSKKVVRGQGVRNGRAVPAHPNKLVAKRSPRTNGKAIRRRRQAKEPAEMAEVMDDPGTGLVQSGGGERVPQKPRGRNYDKPWAIKKSPRKTKLKNRSPIQGRNRSKRKSPSPERKSNGRGRGAAAATKKNATLPSVAKNTNRSTGKSKPPQRQSNKSPGAPGNEQRRRGNGRGRR